MRYRLMVWAGFALAGVALADETIGTWTVRAPTSASIVTDLGGSWDWLNVVNEAIDVNIAFSGESIIGDGYANASAGQEVQVIFDPPVVNLEGNDLVLYDARFDDGVYSVRSGFDGFAASVGVGSFVDTGEDRSYYYDLDNGPFPADIWGAALDLSDIGVPLGSSIAAIRFRAENDACDPVGIGAIVPGCAADVNGDGQLNVLDFVAFQSLWQGMDPAADCDASGAFDVLDFVCFQQVFVKGCG